MVRRGRRPAGSDTRQDILAAARAAFAESGYDRATIRAIAADAGVDPALIHHYFGTKEELFAAAIEVPFRVADALPGVFAGPPDEVGERVARLFFSVWESPASREALLGQLRHSLVTGDPPAIAGFVTQVLLHRVADRLAGDDRELRVEMAAAHLVGVAVLRYVARIEPIASAPVDRLVQLVAPRVQAYLS